MCYEYGYEATIVACLRRRPFVARRKLLIKDRNVKYFFWLILQEELGGIEPKRRMRYENPCDARLLREAYARTTRRPHTETFAEKVVGYFF